MTRSCRSSRPPAIILRTASPLCHFRNWAIRPALQPLPKRPSLLAPRRPSSRTPWMWNPAQSPRSTPGKRNMGRTRLPQCKRTYRSHGTKSGHHMPRPLSESFGRSRSPDLSATPRHHRRHHHLHQHHGASCKYLRRASHNRGGVNCSLLLRLSPLPKSTHRVSE